MERWLIDNGLQLALVLVGVLLAWSKLNGYIVKMEGQVKEDSKKLGDHLASNTPHAVCGLEGMKIETVKAALHEIKEKLDVMDDRILELIRNGKNVKKAVQ